MAEYKVLSEINAVVWRIEVAPGARVSEGDTLVLLESMKMEIPVTTERSGTVKSILVREQQQVKEGEAVAIIET